LNIIEGLIQLKNLETYYTENYSEEVRLHRSQAHSIEFSTTMKFLLEYLPEGCNVLDCCAGAGVYAFPLARHGYQVTAGDLVEKHVEIMKQADKDALLTHIYQGDVLDMSKFEDQSFDAVICMGALYHLMSEKEREACIAECLRVLKNGGILALAYINRNAMYIAQLSDDNYSVENANKILDSGINRVFYGMNFGEMDELTNKFSLEKMTDIGVDGLVYPLFDRLNELSETEFADYLAYHLSTCQQSSILGHSCHGLWIGKKYSAS